MGEKWLVQGHTGSELWSRTGTQACAIPSAFKGDVGALRDHAARRGHDTSVW